MNRRTPAIALCIAILLLAACAPAVSVQSATQPVIGSRNLVDKAFDLSGFTSVEVANGATVLITRSDTTSVVITVDDNAVEHLQVEKKGDALFIGLKGGSYRNVTIKATITRPELTGAAASGGSEVRFEGFKSSKPVTFKTSGGGKIVGSISGGAAKVTATGGSDITLAGEAQGLVLDHSGGGSVKLGEFVVNGDANVDVSGGSDAEINVTGKVSGTVSGGAQLRVRGGALVQVRETGGGKVLR